MEPLRSAYERRDLCRPASPMSTRPLLEHYHFQHLLRRPPSSARSRCLEGRFQHRTPACGARCVGVEGSRWLIWPKLLQVLWARGGKVAPKEQVVDNCLREERPWLVLLLRVEDFSEIKADQGNADYSMYSTFLTASPGSVLFSRSNLLKRKDLCFSCLRLGLIRHRRSLRSSHLSSQVCHDSHRVTL